VKRLQTLDKYICRLDVSMHNSAGMEISKSLKALLKHGDWIDLLLVLEPQVPKR
jgi:hypothetical protein